MPDLSPAPAVPGGKTTWLKRYEILAPLGVGGTAELLLARATGSFGITNLFAIKRIRPGMAGVATRSFRVRRSEATAHS